MSLEILTAAAAGLLPTVIFLAVLVVFDSYKLISAKGVLLMILVGALAATLSYFANEALLSTFDISFRTFSRYVAPLVEESAKAVVLVYLLRTHRIGFLVDAAIFGFAIGTGFAIIENLYYLRSTADLPIDLWLVRGFGTAIMHGGVAAIFAVTAQALSERKATVGVADILPGLLIAILTHSLYNHFTLTPWLSTLIVLTVLPLLALYVFRISENALQDWLDVGFDADAELLRIMNSGEIADSHIGQYLESFKKHFSPEVVFDLLCYLRVHVELAIRAKGVLLMRESGFETEPDQQVKESLAELKSLEARIGKTGLLALKPFLHLSRKDLWQLYMLGK